MTSRHDKVVTPSVRLGDKLPLAGLKIRWQVGKFTRVAHTMRNGIGGAALLILVQGTRPPATALPGQT